MPDLRHRFIGLDLIRFFAASVVMLLHANSWESFSNVGGSLILEPLRGTAGSPTPHFWWGWVGVHIFFVVSGFVIAFSASRGDAWSFMRSRVLRLVPGVLVCATIGLFVLLIYSSVEYLTLIKRYILTIIFWPFGGWINGVYWTLAIEISFYLIVFAILSVKRKSWIEPTVVTIGLASSVAWLLHYIVFGASGTTADFGIMTARWWDLILVNHGVYFAVGVLLWSGAMRGWTAGRVFILSVLVLGGLLPIFTQASLEEASFGFNGVQWVPILIWLATVAVLWASVRFDASLTARLGSFHSVIRVIGLSTYPLYLVHDVLGKAMLRSLSYLGVETFTALGTTLGTMVAVAIVVTITAERWLRDVLGRILSYWPLKLRAQVERT